MLQPKRAVADLIQDEDAKGSASISDHQMRGYLGYNLKRAYMVFAPKNAAVLSRFGLKVQSFTCLSLIKENADLTPSQVADYFQIERSNLVAILDELTVTGLILRERALKDRRRIALRLTSQGESVLERAQAALAKSEAKVLARLTPQDCATLAELLARIEGPRTP